MEECNDKKSSPTSPSHGLIGVANGLSKNMGLTTFLPNFMGFAVSVFSVVMWVLHSGGGGLAYKRGGDAHRLP